MKSEIWEDYMKMSKIHPTLSLEQLVADRKTQLCIKEWLHVNAWKHRMNGDKQAMLESQKMAMIALRQSKTYDHILKLIWSV